MRSPAGARGRSWRRRSGSSAAAREARAAGRPFDVGHGGGTFSWAVAEAALADGFRPDTISTDLHRFNIAGPVHDLATTMSKFLHPRAPPRRRHRDGHDRARGDPRDVRPARDAGGRGGGATSRSCASRRAASTCVDSAGDGPRGAASVSSPSRWSGPACGCRSSRSSPSRRRGSAPADRLDPAGGGAPVHRRRGPRRPAPRATPASGLSVVRPEDQVDDPVASRGRTTSAMSSVGQLDRDVVPPIERRDPRRSPCRAAPGRARPVTRIWSWCGLPNYPRAATPRRPCRSPRPRSGCAIASWSSTAPPGRP